MPARLKITHFASGDIWAGAEKQLYTLVKNLTEDKSNHVSVLLMNEGELADKLREGGIPVTVIEESVNNSFLIFTKILRYLYEYKPNVVHTHGHKENILVSIANIFVCHAANVRTVHGAAEYATTGLGQFHKKLIRKLDIWTGNYLTDKIIAVTEELEDKLEKFFARKKLTVIVNGIDSDLSTGTDVASDFRRSMPEKHHIGMAGRLYEVKRVDIFIRIAALLLSKNSEIWQFHVFGDGPMRQKYEALAKELKIENKVCFHGHRQDIDKCLSSLDILVMCSDHEGMPMVALESIVAGTPVIAHSVGGLNNLLEKYSERLLVRDNIPKSYVILIEKHFQDENRDIISGLMEDVKIRFSAKNSSKKYADLYKYLS